MFRIGAQSNSCRIRCVICWCLWCHFPLNNSEKAALDIMELIKIDPGYYMTKNVDLPICVVNFHPFIACQNHRKYVGRCCVIPKKAARQKHWNWRNPMWKVELLESSTSLLVSWLVVLYAWLMMFYVVGLSFFNGLKVLNDLEGFFYYLRQKWKPISSFRCFS